MGAQAARPRSRTPASTTSRSSRRSPATSTATQHLRPARDLRGRPDRHPGHQRQQQLLDRLDRAVPGAPGDRGRRSPSACSRRLRADGEGRARHQVHRPPEPDRQVRRGHARRAGHDTGAPLALRRCSAAPAASTLEVRHEARDVRARSPRRRAATRRRTRTRSSARSSSLEEVMASPRGVRPADAPPVLPAHVRRRRGGPLLATSSRRSTGSSTRSTSPPRR